MANDPKNANKPKIEDLPNKKPTAEEQEATKGGLLGGGRFVGGIGVPPSNTVPVMTDKGGGVEEVDGT